jgi:phosphonate transport system permease protein
MAVVVGIGPFAGMMAIVLHSIGAMGKLYSEAIESIDSGPIEAVTATGANRFQTVIFAVVPQVVPQFLSFTMYRWDINVRMSTVVGLVGGGGIGFLLIQYINLLQWSQAATALWLIAITVMVMDYASAAARARLV